MKKLIFLFSLLACFLLANDAAAQNRYGASTFPLDTLSATDAITFTLPSQYGGENITELSTWQIRLTRIADTMTVYVYLEESIDEVSANPDYVVIDTIANGITIGPALTEQKYLVHTPIRGKKQRLRMTSTGSAATTEVEVDAWSRNKVPLLVTDEY